MGGLVVWWGSGLVHVYPKHHGIAAKTGFSASYLFQSLLFDLCGFSPM